MRTIDPVAESLSSVNQYQAYVAATQAVSSITNSYVDNITPHHGIASASSYARGRSAVRSYAGQRGGLVRDMSLGSLDKASNPGPGHYETNVSSCVSTEATRKLKHDAQLKKAADRFKGTTPMPA